MVKKYNSILVVLLIVASFMVGMMWTKIQYLQTSQSPTPNTVKQLTANVQKSSKPNVELFVMSYCPYGLQTQKAIVPVLELLGNKINASVKWVSYAMHGQKEVEENLRQFCIQKDQNDKYLKYLRCFVASNDTNNCQNQAGIDTNKLQSCYTNSDNQFGIMKAFNDKASWLSGQYPKFVVDEALNTKYGVQGSPTLVINGQTVNAPRSAEEMKQLICGSFNNQPSECNKTLATTQEAPGAGAIGLAYNPPAGAGNGGCN